MENELLTCNLCGHRFAEDDKQTCSACPLSRACRMICCPNCGYQWPATSWTVDLFKGLFSKRKTNERKSRSST